MKSAVVIGAGIGGLAASVRLAHQGYQVTVFEANAFVGGKINSKQLGRYRFDMGPSVFTCPQYIKELYDLCDEDFGDFPYEKLGDSFTYYYPDGQRFTLPNGREALLDVIEQELGEDRQSVVAYLNKAEKNYDRITPLFIEASLHRWQHLMNKKLVTALAHLPAYNLGQTMHQVNKRAFRNPKTVQLFNRFASYNGSSPYEAPAMLNMISHLELNDGAYLPAEGMVQIPQKVKGLADKLGVEFRFNERVEEILVENGQAIGVRTAKGTHTADVVFSNMDVAFTYEKLMPKEVQPKKILRQEKSSSALVFYLGIKKTFPELGVHNIFFSEDYKSEYDHIFKKKEVYPDPTIYLNITSKRVPGDAPESCENWFLMVNTPVNVGQDWEENTRYLRQVMLAKVSKALGEDITPLIEVESVMNPVNIEDWYSGKMGSIYGNASNNSFATFYRHANFSKRTRGLYFVGVTVHPGGGIPLALNSAKIATRCLEEDLQRA
ncbi:MAG TPA: phytoene desaturase [Cytophagales bacterium]|nr:phytoene desaturase [Cytophagales bacterium]HAA21059.1 phytoene desaturase [Cytophagales bacterium]HAP59067.1 phytoene desaturase [Cytophagales bacterium]